MRIKQIAAFIMSGVIFTSVPGSLYVNAEDKASDAYYDNIKLYDCALSSEAITGIRIEPRPVEDADNPRLLFANNSKYISLWLIIFSFLSFCFVINKKCAAATAAAH